MAFSGGETYLYTPDRDYVGYGLEQPRDCWPNGAKIAVSFVLNYEEGGESTLWNGDAKSIGGLHETFSDRDVQVGRRDFLVESQYEYGIRQGVPRLMKLFDKYGYKFTLWMVARSAEVTGFYPRLLAEKGHEIADHGNRWTVPGETYEEAKWHHHQSIDRLQKATGRTDVHKERGVPLLYSSDAYAADTPYYIQDPLVVKGEEDHGMLCVPYSLTNNDVVFLALGARGVGKANDFFELLKADFDYLYAEGERGTPKMMTIAMHSRVLGKPGRIMAIKRFMEYISKKPDVWVATRQEIAAQWREKFPYEKEGFTAALHADVKKY
ncbi:hypothetical protein JCM24511_06658 [Saitozyma sp. JCM 24511]|nr:hypothetical protein JCM24511_06658 [Saitozyma sp. JCM 24511]